MKDKTDTIDYSGNEEPTGPKRCQEVYPIHHPTPFAKLARCGRFAKYYDLGKCGCGACSFGGWYYCGIHAPKASKL